MPSLVWYLVLLSRACGGSTRKQGLVVLSFLQDGADKWAAFFETRRYAAYLGATTEFSKWEGITFSPSKSKLYTAMTESE